MRTVKVAFYTPKHERFVWLVPGQQGTRSLSWGKLPATTKISWGSHLWAKQADSFALNFNGRAYLRIRYG